MKINISAYSLICFAFISGSAHADGFGFMTPSGNIYCNGMVGGGGSIGCAIISRSGAPAKKKPDSCLATWGHSFYLEATGPAGMSCSSKPERVDYTDKAGYGQTGEFGSIICKSERTGLTCSNKSGHGFFLSRAKQRVF